MTNSINFRIPRSDKSMAQILETKPVLSTVPPVFIPGKYHPISISVDPSSPSSPPKQLLIFTPSEQGTYPVILFFHGFYLSNYFYSDLLQHISSHGFIIVAPQVLDKLIKYSFALIPRYLLFQSILLLYIINRYVHMHIHNYSWFGFSVIHYYPS